MSEIKVNKITPRAACGTTQLGDSGDTFTIPSGATISNLGTATGFGGTGVVSWDTGSIKTVDFTAVTGTGYFVDTATTGAVDVTLPLSPAAGDVVGVSDYAKNFNTANCTLLRNGSNIGGQAVDGLMTVDGAAVTLVYVDATKGWIVTDSGNQTDAPTSRFVAATGGCITTCGNYKVHTFLSPNTFVVTCAGNCAGSNTVDYLVVAGGGGAGGYGHGAGGGAGGYRESPGTASGSYTVSPLGVSPAVALPVTATPYAITVGGGGAGNPAADGSNGNPSTFSTITSAGGGFGSRCLGNAGPGGSGGGGGNSRCGGTGNTPVETPAQGTDGGNGSANLAPGYGGGGGGGATVVGAVGGPGAAGDGGDGATSSINTAPTARAGGGGGSIYTRPTSCAGCGGAGGGGAGSDGQGFAGAINTGGGGGGSERTGGSYPGGLGGSGIVIIRYKYQ